MLSSMCKGPVSYYTLAEQREDSIRRKISQREISRGENTYICMVIPVHCRHWVAVRVTISPFSLERFPGQIFFSSQLRYGPCCCDIDHKITSDIVKNTVQRVIDSSYRSVCWNYSSSHQSVSSQPGELSNTKAAALWTILPIPISSNALRLQNPDSNNGFANHTAELYLDPGSQVPRFPV